MDAEARRAARLRAVKEQYDHEMPDRLARLCRRMRLTPYEYAEIERECHGDYAAIEGAVKRDFASA